MNASIITKPNVNDSILDIMSMELPVIFAQVLDIPGGNLARLKPEQVSLEFSRASTRDTGSDIRIMVYAKKNDPRSLTENQRAKTILEKINALINKPEEEYSIDIRLYFMEIGSAELTLSV